MTSFVAARAVGRPARSNGTDTCRSRGTATALSRATLPRALADCSDPMTGFFAVRADHLNLERLDPSGFKILLEILATHDLAVAEVPFTFGRRHAGVSKATMRQGVLFLRQLLALRRLAGRGVPVKVGGQPPSTTSS